MLLNYGAVSTLHVSWIRYLTLELRFSVAVRYARTAVKVESPPTNYSLKSALQADGLLRRTRLTYVI